MYLVHGLQDEQDLLPLKLEYPHALEVAASECGAGDDIPCQVLHMRPDIYRAWKITADYTFPFVYQLCATFGEIRQHALKMQYKFV
jgi:hypothetical protein